MQIHDQDTFYRVKKEGIQEGIQQGIQQGLQQGIQDTKIETARKLLAMGLTFEQVAEGTGLPLETVEKIAKNLLSKESL